MTTSEKTASIALPDTAGHFGQFGGRYAPETLMSALFELEAEYRKAKADPGFLEDLDFYLREFAGRPSRMYFARRLTEHFGGARIYLKREDLNHTGAHKINNTVGQILLARRMGKPRIIAETGAGQHGVATATVCALFGMECHVFMGTEDIERQKLNCVRMELLGAEVVPVTSGSRTLKDATNEAMRDWITNVRNTFYIVGSAIGPHPYPMMVRDFQTCIGREAKEQILEVEGRLPDCLVACVGGGSNAIGLFHPFYEDSGVKMLGAEAAGEGVETGRHAASLSAGTVGTLHGTKSFLLHDEDGQIQIAHSISAGLDYPGVGPEHAFYKDSGRAEYVGVTDDEALDAFSLLSRLEGIIPALESAHAIAAAGRVAPSLSRDQIMVICLSGRGDKDVPTVADLFEKSGRNR